MISRSGLGLQECGEALAGARVIVGRLLQTLWHYRGLNKWNKVLGVYSGVFGIITIREY